MTLKIGVGRGFSSIHKLLQREFATDPNILIFPRFFDSKRDLLAGKWQRYVFRLKRRADEVEIALWPDYVYQILKMPGHITYIFPLHNLRRESDFVLRLSDHYDVIVGLPKENYRIPKAVAAFLDFCHAHDLRIWVLGLLRENRNLLRFAWGTDVTTFSVPGWRFEDMRDKEQQRFFIHFLRVLSTQRRLISPELIKIAPLGGDEA